MTTYEPGDVVLIAFPYTAGTGEKKRPALVLLDSGDSDVVVARITTQAYDSAFDLAIADWAGTGLLAASFVRLH